MKNHKRIGKRTRAVMVAMSDDDDRRSILSSVHFRPDNQVEATNGSLLLRARIERKDDEQPELAFELDESPECPDDAVVPAAALKSAVKHKPKKIVGKLTDPLVQKGVILSGDGKDLHRTEFDEPSKKYPDTDLVNPLPDPDSITVMVSNIMLELLCKAARVLSPGQAQPICLTISPNQHAIGVKMPNEKSGDVTGIMMQMSTTKSA